MMNDAMLRKIDLNLLLAFSVLMQERNVSRAAERLLLGQPGLSAALKRLRDTLGDELFVRVGRSLQPTPRALSLAPAIEDALSGIERALRPVDAFDPADWRGELRIATCDNLESSFFGPLLARLRREAQHAKLISVAFDGPNAARLLDEGAYDFSISVHDEPASWHVRAPLFEQTALCIYDGRHLAYPAPLSLKHFAAAPHVTVSTDGSSTTHVDAALAGLGYRRQVVGMVPRFSALPMTLQALPAIATVPEYVARCIAQQHDLTISKLPFALPPDVVTMLYRRVDQADSRSVWLRRLTVEVVRDALSASGCSIEVSTDAGCYDPPMLAEAE